MNEFEKFKKAYLTILLQSMFHTIQNKHQFKCPIIKNELYSPKMKNQYKNAIKNISWIYKDQKIDLLHQQNVINQAPGSMNYPGFLCDEILKIHNGISLSNEQVISFIANDWKYFNELKKFGKTIKIFKFDFSNIKDISQKFHLPNFDKKILNDYIHQFNDHENASGAFIPINDLMLFVFNENKEFMFNKKTILHQFTHYIQYLLNVEIIQVPEKIDIEKLRFLHLSEEKLKSLQKILIDKEEIIPYINDFCADVYDLLKYYVNEGKIKSDDLNNEYIKYFVKKILNSKSISQLEQVKDYFKINRNLMPIYVVIGCYIFHIEIQKIQKIMFERR